MYIYIFARTFYHFQMKIRCHGELIWIICWLWVLIIIFFTLDWIANTLNRWGIPSNDHREQLTRQITRFRPKVGKCNIDEITLTVSPIQKRLNQSYYDEWPIIQLDDFDKIIIGVHLFWKFLFFSCIYIYLFN